MGGMIMPAGYAHFDFGQQVYRQLDLKLQEQLRNHMDLYNIGVHGPDILFYHQALKKNEVKDLGFSMHQKKATDFFNNAKHIIIHSLYKEDSFAYICGFITHYVLDSECHGYIGRQEKELHMTHSEIESEFDRELLVQQGKDPLRTSLTSHIHPSLEVSQVIAPFFHLTDKDIYKSLKDLLFYLRMIKAPGKLKRGIVLFAMKIAGIYPHYKGLMINYEKNEISRECIDELIRKKNQAVKLAVALIEEYSLHLNDNNLNERFGQTYE